MILPSYYRYINHFEFQLNTNQHYIINFLFTYLFIYHEDNISISKISQYLNNESVKIL